MVAGTGEKNVAWLYRMRSVVCVSWLSCGESVMCHSLLVEGFRVPVRMVVPWWSIVQLVLVKVAVQPASQS